MQSKSKATAVTNLEHTFSLFADVLVSPFLLQHARQQTSQKNRLCLSKISKLRFLDYFVSRHTTHSTCCVHLYVPPHYQYVHAPTYHPYTIHIPNLLFYHTISLSYYTTLAPRILSTKMFPRHKIA